MYRCDNDSIIPVEYNCSNVAMPVCRRAGEVIISLADDTSCCPQKVCGEAANSQSEHHLSRKRERRNDVISDSTVCNQSLCDLLPPECKYGEKLVSYYRQDSCCPDYVCGEFPLVMHCIYNLCIIKQVVPMFLCLSTTKFAAANTLN